MAWLMNHRFKYNNCIFGAITISRTEPYMPEYLEDNMNELLELKTSGMKLAFKFEDSVFKGIKEETIEISLICLCADSKAKPLVLGLFQFNKAEGGCTVCNMPCTRVQYLKKGVYLEFDLNTREKTEAITFESFAHLSRDFPERIKFQSPLHVLKHFDICKQSPLDALHICWLGVCD
jgi:hypothetical protein